MRPDEPLRRKLADRAAHGKAARRKFAAELRLRGQLLAEASQNAAIRAVFQMLRPYIHTMMVQNVSVLGADGCTAHLKIVAAIEARNSELAKTHMAEHLNRSMEQTNMLNYVKKLDAPAD